MIIAASFVVAYVRVESYVLERTPGYARSRPVEARPAV